MDHDLILYPFNAPFFILSAIPALVYVLLHLIARKRPKKQRAALLSAVMLLTVAGFAVYKLLLSRDASYSAVLLEAGLLPFNWWNELPLQLCNINMLMIPISLAADRRSLYGFCFFSGTLGALTALVMPSTGFSGCSILLPRMIGYFLTHWMVFFGALSLLTLGIYQPKYRDIPKLLTTFAVICTAIFGINLLLRCTGLSPTANYWFNVATEGNPLLEIFYSWIPIPLLYIAPAFLIMALYMLVVISVFNMVSRAKG